MDVDDDYSEDTSQGGGSDDSSVLAPLMTLAAMESLTLPLVQELVIPADMKCLECQKRIREIISRSNETESVMVSFSEKKVVITCNYLRASKTQITSRSSHLSTKSALIKRMFGSSWKP